MSAKNLSESEVQFIHAAARYLEEPSFLLKVTNLIGMPIEKGIEALPDGAQHLVTTATRKSLDAALGLAVKTIGAGTNGSFENGQKKSIWTDRLHKAATAVTGGVGGFFGLLALPIELPITTVVMLRGISSIADDYGHDAADFKTRLECLSVFAMGAPASGDDAIDSAYFTSRYAMAQAIEQAAKWAAKKTAQEIAEAVASKSAPSLIQLIARIAARFDVIVTEAMLAKAIPGVAVVTGALINAAFTDHFNSVARYHFGIKALEARHGDALVRSEYDRVKPSSKPSR